MEGRRGCERDQYLGQPPFDRLPRAREEKLVKAPSARASKRARDTWHATEPSPLYLRALLTQVRTAPTTLAKVPPPPPRVFRSPFPAIPPPTREARSWARVFLPIPIIRQHQVELRAKRRKSDRSSWLLLRPRLKNSLTYLLVVLKPNACFLEKRRRRAVTLRKQSNALHPACECPAGAPEDANAAWRAQCSWAKCAWRSSVRSRDLWRGSGAQTSAQTPWPPGGPRLLSTRTRARPRGCGPAVGGSIRQMSSARILSVLTDTVRGPPRPAAWQSRLEHSGLLSTGRAPLGRGCGGAACLLFMVCVGWLHVSRAERVEGWLSGRSFSHRSSISCGCVAGLLVPRLLLHAAHGHRPRLLRQPLPPVLAGRLRRHLHPPGSPPAE